MADGLSVVSNRGLVVCFRQVGLRPLVVGQSERDVVELDGFCVVGNRQDVLILCGVSLPSAVIS